MLHILINSDSRVCLYIWLFFLEISIPANLKSSMEWSFELKCIETGLSYFLHVLYRKDDFVSDPLTLFLFHQHKLCADIFYSGPHKLHLMFCNLFSIQFNSKGHSIDDFRFAGIEISRKNNTIYRQTRESLFIKMCNTQQEGMNKRK